jgi:hypothetical protein
MSGEAIAGGNRDPRVLAAMTHGNVRGGSAAIEKALEGMLLGAITPVLIRLHLDHITLLDRLVAAIEDEIEAALAVIPAAWGVSADGVRAADPGPARIWIVRYWRRCARSCGSTSWCGPQRASCQRVRRTPCWPARCSRASTRCRNSVSPPGLGRSPRVVGRARAVPQQSGLREETTGSGLGLRAVDGVMPRLPL